MSSLRLLRNAVLSLLLGIAALAGCALLVFTLVSDTVLLGWLLSRVEAGTDARLEYATATLKRGVISRLTITQLAVAADDGSFTLDSEFLDIQLSLPQLLLARLDVPQLQIGATRISIRGESGSASTDWWRSLQLDKFWLSPVIHDVRVASLSLAVGQDNWALPAGSVRELNLQVVEDKAGIQLAADVDVSGQALHLIMNLPGLKEALAQQHLPFALAITGAPGQSELEGQLDFSGDALAITASLDMTIDNPGALLAAQGVQPPGKLTLQAELSGTPEQLSAEQVVAGWQAGTHGNLQAQGRIEDVISQTGIALTLQGELQQAAWLAPVLPGELDRLERIAMHAVVGGSGERLQLSGVELRARSALQLTVELDGGFDWARQASGSYAIEQLDASLKFDAPTTRAARALLFSDVPELGAIEAQARLASSTSHPAVEGIQVKTRHAQGIELSIGGSIREVPLDSQQPNRGYALDVSLHTARATPLLEALGMAQVLEGPLEAGFSISGDTRALALEKIQVMAGDKASLQLTASGSLAFADLSAPNPLASTDITLELHSHSTQALAELLHADAPPELGGLDLRAHVQGNAGQQAIESFRLTTRKAAPVQASLQGRAASLVLMPKPAIEGVDLQLSLHTDDITAVKGLFKKDPPAIPALGPLRLSSRVTGNLQALSLTDANLQLGSSDKLLLKGSGRLGKITPAADPVLQGTDLKLTAAAPTSQPLADLLDYRLPPLGPLAGSARLYATGGSYAIENLSLQMGELSQPPEVAAQGKIGSLLPLAAVDVTVHLNIDGHRLAEFADRRQLNDLAPLTGEFRLADEQGVLGVHGLQLSSHHPDLSLAISGQYPDLDNPESLQLQVQTRARDLALVGSLLDQDWPTDGPVDVQAKVGREGKGLRLNAQVRAGVEGVDADLLGDFELAPPKISGTLTVHQLSVPDLYVKASEGQQKRKANKDQQNRPVFSRDPFDLGYLKAADLDVDVNVASFDTSNTEAVSAQAAVRLKSGVLDVQPAVIHYPQGKLDLALQVDASQAPRFVFKVFGNNLNPWQTLAGTADALSTDITADVDVDISLSAQGNSPHELATTLDGNLYTTVRNGKMRSSFAQLLFIDLVGWTASMVKDRKYSELTCGVADFAFNQGSMQTNGFFLDTRNIAITGDGSINLGEESVDYVFVPRKKSRLILKAEPVKVKGPLGNPTVTAIPLKSAALTVGSLLFAPYVLVGLAATEYLNGKLDSSRADTPCLVYEKSHPMINTLVPAIQQK